MYTHIHEYQKNKNNYQDIKSLLIGGGKLNYLLVVAPPYNKVTRLDINSEAITKSYFVKWGEIGDAIVDLYGTKKSSEQYDKNSSGWSGHWYVVISSKYRNGSNIPLKIANLLNHYDCLNNKQIKKKFRELTGSDILELDPEYNFIDIQNYSNDKILHYYGKNEKGYPRGIHINIIEELNNCNEDIDVFMSYFSSGMDTKNINDYPFDAINKNGDLNYEIDVVSSNTKYKAKGASIIYGVIGPGLIQEHFDKKYFDFPKNITNVLWYQPGRADYMPWYALLKIKYKKTYLYGFFYARCCYTGFDVIGEIQLYLSKDLSQLLLYGVDADVCKKITRDVIRKVTIKQK